MTGSRGKHDEAYLELLREQNPLSDFFEKCGVKLRRAGREWIGLSPFNNERTPSFTINDEKGFFHCFSSGQNGDIFDAVQHFKGLSFPEAVRFLGGAQEVTAADRERIEKKRQQRQREEKADAERIANAVRRQFEEAQPIEGTHAAAYLEQRGLAVDASWTFDLRFSPEQSYRGYRDETVKETEPLGNFPAMVAAIRDVSGALIGLHRTYLDPTEPRKLTPPGDAERNASKKVLGNITGGMIRLSQIGERLAIGEGIETCRAWLQLRGKGGVSIASAVSLGNLAGSASGSVEHPLSPGKWIPNGEPDMERPGVILPDVVKAVNLLGDGDSDPHMTRQRLRVAGRRFRSQGRQVFVHMAPAGMDFNDVLLAGASDAAV